MLCGHGAGGLRRLGSLRGITAVSGGATGGLTCARMRGLLWLEQGSHHRSAALPAPSWRFELKRTDQRSQDQLAAIAERMVAVAPQPCTPFQVPGLGVVVERHDGTGAEFFTGTDASGEAFHRDTLFPIASATKLATGLAVLRLVDRGSIDLDAAVERYLPEVHPTAAEVTPRMLLSHCSGLPLEVHPQSYSWSEGLSWRALAAACLQTPLQFTPRERVQYSNVGYGLLAQIVERVTDREFPDAMDTLVLRPLALEAYLGRGDLPREPAAILDIRSQHAGTALAPMTSAFSRRLALPWAGLVTTLGGLLTLLRVYTGERPDLIRPETVAEARADQTGGRAGGFGTTDPFLGSDASRAITWPRCAWGLMLELHGDKRPHWVPPASSPESFGQIGSTGCLAWYDPTRGTAWAFMAPRTTDSGWLLRHGIAIGNVALQNDRIAAARSAG